MSRTKAPPKFTCRCSTRCTRCCGWFARAPLADCFPDDGTCDCEAHGLAAEMDAVYQRRLEAGACDTGRPWLDPD